MIFSKKYQIIVSNPCHENWEKMTTVDKGRFCDSCAKKVTDYSILSDKEINERMRNASGNMCGRFRKDQLEKTFTLQPKIQLSSQRRFFQYLISILLASKAFVNKAIGQTDSIKTEQTDSLKSIAREIDSTCIEDTVAIAKVDTLKFQIDTSIWVFNPQIYTVDSIFTITMGSFYPVDIREEEISFLPKLFDSLKNIARIKSSISKEMTEAFAGTAKDETTNG